MLKLKAENLSKHYGPVTALESLSIAVSEGEFVSLLGPSGSGKTTFLMMVAGLNTPDSGRLWINGRESTYLPIQQRDIGMVFQNYALFPHLSVFENIAFPLRMRRIPEGEIRTAAGQALEMVRLSHVADRLPRALSGGQQQRIALARCLVYKPSIILMDEPLGALDRNLREEMQLEIKMLHRTLGTTLLYVTHDQDEAMTMSDRICLMNNGAVEQLGTPRELYLEPATEFTAAFLGDSNIFDGILTGYDGDLAELVSSGGHRLLAPARERSAPPGSRVRIMVRPEQLTLESAAGGDRMNVLEATVRDTILVGGVSRVFLRAAGDIDFSVTALARNWDGMPETGTGEMLAWPVSATRYFL